MPESAVVLSSSFVPSPSDHVRNVMRAHRHMTTNPQETSRAGSCCQGIFPLHDYVELIATWEG